MFWWILAAIILIFMICACFWAFCFAFVRRRNTTDLGFNVGDDFLGPYVEEMKEGMRFLDTTPYTTEEIVSYDGLKLRGRYYSAGSPNTVIVFHGYRSIGRRDYSCAVGMYMEMGLNVLMVDQRSHGESEGKLITFGVKERHDVLSWIEHVIARDGKETKILLSGLSMGSSTVMMAASLELPQNLVGIVADCGYTSPAEIIGKVAKQTFGLKPQLAARLLNVLSRTFGGFDLYECNTVDILAKSEIPILFIHGEADDFVPCEMSVRSYEAAKGYKDICLVKDAGHGLAYMVDKKGVRAKLEQFFQYCLTEGRK